MGVSSTTNRLVYTGDASTLSFSFPYYFFATTDIEVYKYDTAAGSITEQVEGTDYSVSATANAQGLYPNGGSVVFVSAPTSTEKVVIFRDPPETQVFALAQNGVIPSAALVQQLDYLTLLVQRLEDQVGRALVLPDGLAPTFSMALPDDLALQPGTFLQVNDAGTGISLSSDSSAFQKVTVAYTDLQTASTTKHFKIFTLPAKAMLTGLVIKHTTVFAGTSISALVAELGISTDYLKFLSAFNLLATVADSTFDNVLAQYLGSFANGTDIYLSAVATGANLSALSAGSVDVYYAYQTI